MEGIRLLLLFLAARTAHVATSFAISKEGAVIFKTTVIANQFSYSYIKFLSTKSYEICFFQ
jgi:hypothetical protein